MAAAIGAKPPRRLPKWLGRLFAGEMGVMMMTELRGSSNAKAKRELGWEPRYPAIWKTLAGAEPAGGFESGVEARKAGVASGA